MSSNRGLCGPTDLAAVNNENFLDPSLSANNFSDLLWMPHDQHKVSRINDDDYKDRGVHVRYLWNGIAYHDLCEPFLLRLGLYQVSRMDNINIDPSFLASLVERWRPETHSFHLPMGEMTITLQDVSCLWALPITGSSITGPSDSNWPNLVDELLGARTTSAVLKKRDLDRTNLKRFTLLLSMP